jgi:hypothetical protein
MEIYKRKVGYEDLNYRVINNNLPITASSYLITATTLYFPVFLNQNLEDIGVYTDVENPVYEIVDFSGVWNLSNTGAGQTPCLTLNNCTVSFNSTPITFYGANNGSISATIVGCPGPQTISWSGPNNFTSSNLTINNLAYGNYTIKVVDANCNTTYANYFLTQPQSLSILLETNDSQTNVTSPGGCNGTASVTTLGGQPPYTYTWYSIVGTVATVLAGPSTTITGLTSLCAGQYSAQITDASNTTVSQFFNITEPTPITGTVLTTTNVTCFGGNDGSMTISAVGGINGYTYVLTGPVNNTITTTGNATFNNLLACPSNIPCYSVQISDSFANTSTISSINITSLSNVNLTVSSTNIPIGSNTYNIGCFGSDSGNITISPSGGQSPYIVSVIRDNLIIDQLSISNPYNLFNLDAATYQFTIQDSNGCNGPTQTVVLKQKPLLNVNINPISTTNGYNITCFNGTKNITVNTSYTTNPTTIPTGSNTFKYYIDGVLKTTALGPTTNVNINNISAGTHTLTVVDSTIPNCSGTTTFTLTQPPLPLFVSYGVISVEDGSCACGINPDSCRQAVIDINGGVSPYTITWSGPGQSGLPTTSITSDISCNGQTISVTVTDSNNCTFGPISITLTI